MRLLGRGTGHGARRAQARHRHRPAEDLSDFFRLLGGMIDGFTRARRSRSNELLRDPGTTFLLVTSPEREPIDEAIYFRRRLKAARMPLRRRDRQPRPRTTRSGDEDAGAAAGAARRRGRPRPRARRASRGRVRRRARARPSRRRERRAPRRAARRRRAAAARPAARRRRARRRGPGATPRGAVRERRRARRRASRCAPQRPSSGGMDVHRAHLPVTPAERAARGKAARAELPRSRHAEWVTPADRPDPIALLEEQADSRVPELVPIRYGRMAASPFAFFRGAAAVMAADLAGTPDHRASACSCAATRTSSNFGVFASPERDLVFDLNDFDETLPGPWEWDVKRLAASVAVAAREPRLRPQRERRAIARDAVARAIARRCASFAAHDDARRLVRARSTRASIARAGSRDAAAAARAARFDRDVAKARRKDSTRAFAKLTQRVDGRPRIVSDPPLIVPIERAAARRAGAGARRAHARADRRSYRAHPAARPPPPARALPLRRPRAQGRRRRQRRHAGVDRADARPRRRRPAVPAGKEAQPSVLEPFAGASALDNHGQRVVEGQRLMQAASDIFLGWVRTTGHRRRRARLLRAPAVGLEGLGRRRGDDAGRTAPPTRGSARWTLARAHARSRRRDRDRRLPRLQRRASTARSPTSPRPTPTRTSATTAPCSTRSTAAACAPRPASERPGAA